MKNINRDLSYQRTTNGSITTGSIITGKIVNGVIKVDSSSSRPSYLTSVQQNDLVEKLILEAKRYFENNKLEQASFLYQEALKIDSKNIETLNGLGLIASRTGMLVLAAEFFNMAWELNPDDLATNQNLAYVYTKSSRINEAILHNICVLNIDNNNIDAHSSLARLNEQQGDLDLALHHYQFAYELNPEDPENLLRMVQIDASVVKKEQISTLENLLDSPNLSLHDRSRYYFSLAKIYHVNGEYDKAYACSMVANISKGEKFDLQKHKCNITQLMQTFSSYLFEKVNNEKRALDNKKPIKSDQPVFIVGMPCSGIDLVEKMLIDNPDVYSVGSLNQLQNVLQETGDILESDLSHESLQNLARYYLNEINNIAIDSGNKDAERIINTFSENYLQLGLIALLFPDAHIIHCVRDPFDTCLSVYFKNFAEGKEYAYDLQDIVSYHQQYQRLMSHWQQVLPINIHTVSFDELINSPRVISRQLFDYINISKENIDIDTSKQLRDTYRLNDFSDISRQYYKDRFTALMNGASVFKPNNNS